MEFGFWGLVLLLLIPVIVVSGAGGGGGGGSGGGGVVHGLKKSEQKPFRFKNPRRVKWAFVYGLGRIGLRLANRVPFK